jgi:hypothetical protein
MKQICVLAGDHKQYQEWLRKNKLTQNEAIFGNSREDFDGVEISAIKIVGTFFERRDSRGLYELALTRHDFLFKARSPRAEAACIGTPYR